MLKCFCNFNAVKLARWRLEGWKLSEPYDSERQKYKKTQKSNTGIFLFIYFYIKVLLLVHNPYLLVLSTMDSREVKNSKCLFYQTEEQNLVVGQ